MSDILKQCTTCLELKNLESFHISKKGKHGVTSKCKICESKQGKIKRNNIIINIPETKTCSKCNIEKCSSDFNKRNDTSSGLIGYCKKCQSKKLAEKENREYIDKSLIKEGFKICNSCKEELEKNNFLYKKATCKECILKEDKIKSDKTENILGCAIPEFIKHLQSLFTEGMTLDNHGNCEECWHIDHKIPLATAETEEDIIKLCHYTNLQPLWRNDNLSKGKKYEI